MKEEQIIKEFQTKLKKFILKRVNDEDTANDLLQDVLMKIFEAYPGLRNKERLNVWVYRIARNAITDHYRKKKSTHELADIPESVETDVESLNRELTGCLKPFIDQLPEKYQDALIQTDLGGMSQKEYARRIGLSYSGAKSNVQRARVKLKELFHHCCLIESDRYGHVISYDPKNGRACDQ